ncbi:unnamed protein product [Rotaria magnacalcarata]
MLIKQLTDITLTNKYILKHASVVDIQFSLHPSKDFNPLAGQSFNQPKLSSCAWWNSTGVTFTNSNTITPGSQGIFVDTNNTVYVVNQDDSRIFLWLEDSNTPSREISVDFGFHFSLFVTSNGDIYVDHDDSKRVIKLALGVSTTVMTVSASCTGVFVDTNDTIYCSMRDLHQVVKQSLTNSSSTPVTVAGTGTGGLAPNMLDQPYGVFVDSNFKLYVADCGNHRIQLFEPEQLIGTTLTGTGSTGSLSLKCPISIMMDADGDLFIAERGNNRIIRLSPEGYEDVIIGGQGAGSDPNQLSGPVNAAFDSYGNIFVADVYNNRIQKFYLASDSCGCLPPTIRLVPNASSIAPMRFVRSDDFYILSNILLRCGMSVAITTQWTLHSCNTTCSSPIQIDELIHVKFSDLFIPARTLPYGVYQLKLTAIMKAATNITSTASTYVMVIPSVIQANLIQMGTSLVTRSYQKNFTLDPGTFSTNPDEVRLDASDWNYTYYCTTASLFSSSQLMTPLLPIDDPNYMIQNTSCFKNNSGNQIEWEYNSNVYWKSTLNIFARALKPNKTYQFIVNMTTKFNRIQQGVGYLLVHVEDNESPLISIACVISKMCVVKFGEFRNLNPTTQLALYSTCAEDCSTIQQIKWLIYQGFINASLNTVEWILFDSNSANQDNMFFGISTANLTVSKDIFEHNPAVQFWRFKVLYSFSSTTSFSALSFKVNQKPRNGSCTIDPLNGTAETLFTVICLHWFDEDDIKYYSLYVWNVDSSNPIMLGYSPEPIFQIRLSAGNHYASSQNILVHIRDKLDAVTQYNLPPVIILNDEIETEMFNNATQHLSKTNNSETFVQILASDNQCTVEQAIALFNQILHKLNTKNIELALKKGISMENILVSSLIDQLQTNTNKPSNSSAVSDYFEHLNLQANVRDQLVTYVHNLQIMSIENILWQASSLAQLTAATNQLTRAASFRASDKCHQLAFSLKRLSNQISYEDVRATSTEIINCISNALTAINAPLQNRASVLDLDLIRSNVIPVDYEDDPEIGWADSSLFANGDEFSSNSFEMNRNSFFQKRTAEKIAQQANEVISWITDALSIHLTQDQHVTINTSSVFFSLEITTAASLYGKPIRPIGHAMIQFPSKFDHNTNPNTTVSLRTIVQPLALAGISQSRAYTNFSASISLSVLNRNGSVIPIRNNTEDPIEFIIPRDSNFRVPTMNLQNVTSTKNTENQSFYLHYVNITQANKNLSMSLHFEMRPLDKDLAYLFIYRFDRPSQRNSLVDHTDGSALWCPFDLAKNGYYSLFIDNHRTTGHHSVVFGLRELNSTEIEQYCQYYSVNNGLPLSDRAFNFTANYELRVYQSGCFYLDSNNNWQSDGLLDRRRIIIKRNVSQRILQHLPVVFSFYLFRPIGITCCVIPVFRKLKHRI